jgi:predicted alpha-1,6-mannanase (GH76 family)
MIEELKIAQDIIKRMALNSFLIKGWTITLVVATLLLKGEKFQSFIAFIPILVFWYLDAYFLWLERLYRKLYDWIAKNRLNTDEFLFDMDYRRFIKEEQSKFRIMFSITLGWFYGSIFILTLIYVIFST